MKTLKSHRQSLFILAAILVFSACGNETEEGLVARARGIHDRVITLDTHDDIRVSNFTEERNYTMDIDSQVNIPKMKAGGLDVAWFVVFVGQGELTDEGYVQAANSAMEKFEAIHWLADQKAPDEIEIAYTSDDVRRIVASGKRVAMIAIENAYQVGLDLNTIELFHGLGGRYMSLAHQGHSQFSDSNTGESGDQPYLYNGLSDLGKEAVAEMNRVGIIIDISHPSKDAIMQMFELSRAPVLASHSAARALSDVSRNLDDEQLMALKENGGVVQTVAFRTYIDVEKSRKHQEAMSALRSEIAEEFGVTVIGRREQIELSQEERAAYKESMQEVNASMEKRVDAEVHAVAPAVNVADFVNHIDYLVDLIGIEHVGISSDFDGGGGIEGWADASETFNVTLELVQRGYTEEEIGMIWSGNLLRVLDEVQRVAAEIQAEGI